MKLDEIFCGLPYGFSAFSDIKDSLLDCRARQRLPKDAKTVISVLFPYYLGEEYYKNANVSRYAVSADYHIITGEIMEKITLSLKNEYPENEFEYFIDNSPIPEVRAAVNAGLGVFGKNSLFINEKYGSWVFLGEIVTDRFFEPAKKNKNLCSGCNKCVLSCPGEALGENGVIIEKCLSFLSQKKGELSEEVIKKMEQTGCAWGCDICQTVCPMNKNAAITPIEAFFETAKPYVTAADSIDGRAFAWRGKRVIERNLAVLNKPS
ncbi:MAG: DUF1730 domain-containing protein [Oscillospiraceae bacterium]|nr:DUF1730 domain-containing protein [Oscillospiraceae bacterium]